VIGGANEVSRICEEKRRAKYDFRKHSRGRVDRRVSVSRISGHQTDRMRERYSTVTPEEQRRSIGNVVQLFGARKSGEGSGEGDRRSGEETKKATRS
jgi:hypothetical protein